MHTNEIARVREGGDETGGWPMAARAAAASDSKPKEFEGLQLRRGVRQQLGHLHNRSRLGIVNEHCASIPDGGSRNSTIAHGCQSRTRPEKESERK